MIADEIASESGQETWPFGVEIVYEFPNRQFIRKEQSDFGWDWGPAFAPAGVWQPAYAIQLETTGIETQRLYVRNSDLDISRQGQLNNLPPSQSAPWVLNASIDVLGSLPDGAQMRYAVADSQTNKTVSTGMLANITTSNSTITGTAILEHSSYELWWPRGLGSQKLYNITIDVVDNANTAILASINKRTGFRTIVGLTFCDMEITLTWIGTEYASHF